MILLFSWLLGPFFKCLQPAFFIRCMNCFAGTKYHIIKHLETVCAIYLQFSGLPHAGVPVVPR